MSQGSLQVFQHHDVLCMAAASGHTGAQVVMTRILGLLSRPLPLYAHYRRRSSQSLWSPLYHRLQSSSSMDLQLRSTSRWKEQNIYINTILLFASVFCLRSCRCCNINQPDNQLYDQRQSCFTAWRRQKTSALSPHHNGGTKRSEYRQAMPIDCFK